MPRSTRPGWPGVVLFGIGAAFTLFAANANALVQLAAPDHLRGRLVALYLFAFVGLAPLGSLLSGTLVEIGGTGLAFVVAGTVGLAATAFATRHAPSGLRPSIEGRRGAADPADIEGASPATRRNWMDIFGNRDSGYGSSPAAGVLPSLPSLDEAAADRHVVHGLRRTATRAG